MIDLAAPAQSLGKAASPHGHDHKLLNINIVCRVCAAVENVHHRDGERDRGDAADIAIQRQMIGVCGGACGGKRYGKRGVCAQLAFVFGAVCLKNELIQLALLACAFAAECGGDDVIDGMHRLQNALAAVACGIAIPSFMCFKFSR